MPGESRGGRALGGGLQAEKTLASVLHKTQATTTHGNPPREHLFRCPTASKAAAPVAEILKPPIRTPTHHPRLPPLSHGRVTF